MHVKEPEMKAHQVENDSTSNHLSFFNHRNENITRSKQETVDPCQYPNSLLPQKNNCTNKYFYTMKQGKSSGAGIKKLLNSMADPCTWEEPSSEILSNLACF